MKHWLKKHLLFLISFLIFSISQAIISVQPAFISLGIDCEAAMSLLTHNLRKEAYPFDWIITYQFSDVCTLIENKFTDFLNPAYLVYDEVSILNTKYNIAFRHDFPSIDLIDSKINPINDTDLYEEKIVYNYLDYLPAIQEKYERRINRFFNLLNSQQPLIFIRTRLTPQEALLFVNLMATHYPSTNYRLIVLHTNHTLNYDWCIPHVEHYFTEKKHDSRHGWTLSEEWHTLFSKLNFY